MEGHDDPQHLKQQIDGLINVAGERGEIVHSLIQRLFPEFNGTSADLTTVVI